MKFTFTGKKLEASEDLRAYAEKKIGKLDRFFRTESEAFVTLSTERGRFRAEVTINNNGMFCRVSEVTSDMYASVDSACAAIEQQIRKNKGRLEKRLREGAFDKEVRAFFDPAEEGESDDEFEIVRIKRFPMKPMTTDEAILQMNLLKHEFFAFKNQDSGDAFSVVYRRKNGGYGLISESAV